MKRISAAALAAVLAMPAWAQQPPARPDVMTLTGADGKSHACKILRSYKHPEGGTAFEVRDDVTGDTMTVIDKTSTEAATAPKPADPILATKTYTAAKVQVQFDDGSSSQPPPKPTPQPAKPAP